MTDSKHTISTVFQPEERHKDDSPSIPVLEHESTADPYLVLFDADDTANPKVFFSRQIITVLMSSNHELQNWSFAKKWYLTGAAGLLVFNA